MYTQDYSNPTAHKIESLVKLEAEYGPLPQYSPAIDDVLDCLKEVHISIIIMLFEFYTLSYLSM